MPLLPQVIHDCPVILYPFILAYFSCEHSILFEGISTYLISVCLTRTYALGLCFMSDCIIDA